MSQVLLQADHLEKAFYSAKTGGVVRAVDDVSFTLEQGEFLGLVGESGCGKSTLAKILTGMIPADAGSVAICGREVTVPFPQEIYRNIQMIFQMPRESFNPRWTIGRTIVQTQKNFGADEKAARARAQQCLAMVGLEPEFYSKYPRQMSGGECQRAAIARALSISPPLVICDEITSSLDVSVQAQIVELLQTLRKEIDLSILFISHDLALVSGLCDRVMVMNTGKLVETGPTAKIVNQPKEDYTRRLLASVLEL